MKCQRCEKEFPFEFLSVQHWLTSSGMDSCQQSFLLSNYGGPLCPECERDFKDAFYHSGVNPAIRTKSNRTR